MLKILQVVECCGAGVGRHVLDLSRALVNRGHEVHIFYSPVRADHVFLAGLTLLCERNRGVRRHVVRMERNPSISDIAAAWRLRTCGRQSGRFDIGHSHSTKAGLLARPALFGVCGRMVHTPHGMMTMNPDISGVYRRCLAGAERLLASVTHRIIAVSRKERDHLLRIGMPGRLLAVIPNGIEGRPAPASPSRAALRQKLQIPEGSVCVGFVGRFDPAKRLYLLLEAFARLTSNPGLRAYLVVVGYGRMEAELRATAARLGIARRTRWLGETDGRSVMPALDIFALPSLYESFGYVLLEAAAAGVPIVTTDVGAAREIVGETGAGSIVPAATPARFSACLEDLVRNPGRRLAMGHRGRQVLHRFTVDQMADATVSLYRTVLDSARLSSGSPHWRAQSTE